MTVGLLVQFLASLVIIPLTVFLVIKDIRRFRKMIADAKIEFHSRQDAER